MLRNLTGAVVPSMLENTEIMDVVNYWTTVFFDEFPLLSLFPEKVQSARQFMWEIVTNLNVVGAFNANPSAGIRRDYKRYSAAVAQVFYQSYEWSLTTEQASLLRTPGVARQFYGADQLASAETDLNEAVKEHVRIYWRTLHNECVAKILSDSSPDITISEVAVELDYGIQTITTDADWRLPATDIMTEMNQIVTDFTLENEGRKPNVMIRPPFFHRDVILQNEELRANFAPYMAGIMKGTVSPFNLLVEPSTELAAREIVVNTMTDPVANNGEYANKVLVWPATVFTLIHWDPSENNMSLQTSRDMDNDMRGGIGSYLVDAYNPKRVDAIIAGNHVPIVRRPTRIKIVNFTGA